MTEISILSKFTKRIHKEWKYYGYDPDAIPHQFTVNILNSYSDNLYPLTGSKYRLIYYITIPLDYTLIVKGHVFTSNVYLSICDIDGIIIKYKTKTIASLNVIDKNIVNNKVNDDDGYCHQLIFNTEHINGFMKLSIIKHLSMFYWEIVANDRAEYILLNDIMHKTYTYDTIIDFCVTHHFILAIKLKFMNICYWQKNILVDFSIKTKDYRNLKVINDDILQSLWIMYSKCVSYVNCYKTRLESNISNYNYDGIEDLIHKALCPYTIEIYLMLLFRKQWQLLSKLLSIYRPLDITKKIFFTITTDIYKTYIDIPIDVCKLLLWKNNRYRMIKYLNNTPGISRTFCKSYNPSISSPLNNVFRV